MKNDNRLAIPIALAALAALAAACGDDGGGNVSFGGAQDIGQFRDILDRGEIPGPSTLDANGFFNEHHVELPPADCGQVLCLSAMLSVADDWLTEDYQATLQLAMNSPIRPEDLERRPLDLVVVVDTSGSMNEDDRIGYVKEGLHLLIDELDADIEGEPGTGDRMALLSYNGMVTQWTGLEPLDRARLHGQVDQLVASGSTNFHDGLRDGFTTALAEFDGQRQSRVIMLSDGQPTVGIISDDQITRMAIDYIGSGIGLSTIGVGSDFNVELMRGLAEHGAGNFYFLEDPAAIDEVFTEELDYFVEPLAVAVDLEVVNSESYQLGEVVGTRLWKTGETGGSVFVPGVFLSSRTGDDPGSDGRRGGGSALFVELIPRFDTLAEDPGDVAVVRLTYRLPGTGEVQEQTVEVINPANPGERPELPYYSHVAMAEQYAMYNMYRGLREASGNASYSYDCAMLALDRTDHRAAAWNREFDDPDIAADLALIGQFQDNLRARGAREVDEITGDPCVVDYGYDGCAVAPGGRSPASPAGPVGLPVLLALGAWLATRRRRAGVAR